MQWDRQNRPGRYIRNEPACRRALRRSAPVSADASGIGCRACGCSGAGVPQRRTADRRAAARWENFFCARRGGRHFCGIVRDTGAHRGSAGFASEPARPRPEEKQKTAAGRSVLPIEPEDIAAMYGNGPLDPEEQTGGTITRIFRVPFLFRTTDTPPAPTTSSKAGGVSSFRPHPVTGWGLGDQFCKPGSVAHRDLSWRPVARNAQRHPSGPPDQRIHPGRCCIG